MDTTCGKCGVALSATEQLYDERGASVCERCLLTEQAEATKSLAAGKVKAIAYSGPGLGLLAFVFNPWWLFSIAAIANGVYVFRSLGDTDTAARLNLAAEKVKVAAIAGMVLGGITAILQLLRVMGK
jgi:hypothetical protein